MKQDLTVEEQRDARIRLANWLQIERDEYAEVVKFERDGDNRHKLILAMKDFGLDGDWDSFIGNYYKRAKDIFGVDTPQGRQALGKCITTLIDALETAIALHGDMPKPGVPSGEIDMDALW